LILIEFREPVVFESYAINATQALPQFTNYTAFTTDFNYVSLKSSNDTETPPYLYPQSLAKQLNLDRELNLKKNDFLIFFNTDNIDKILKYYPDMSFSTVFLHEIIHGLGFGGTGTLNNFDSDALTLTASEEEMLEYLAGSSFTPNLLNGIDGDEIDNAKTLEDIDKIEKQDYIFTPLSIYQKYLIDLDTNEKIFKDLGFVHEEFNKCIENSYETLKDCVNDFDTETKYLLKKIVTDYYIKYQSTGFLTADNLIMPIQTFDSIFNSASSISHNDSKLYHTLLEINNNNTEIPEDFNIITELDEDFLMYYELPPASREVLLKTVAKNNKHGLIGPKIVSALKTIGWTEKGEKSSDDIYYIDNDNIPEQNAMKLILKTYLINQENFIEPSIETTTIEPLVETSTIVAPVETTTVEPLTETPTFDPNESDSDNEDDVFDDLNTVGIEEEVDSAEENN